MKKKFILICALAIAANSNSQVVNGDFENWSTTTVGESLMDWGNSNDPFLTNVTKSTDAEDMLYSVKLENISSNGTVFNGMVSFGEIGGHGIPYTGVTGIPDSLIFWTKYDIMTGDKANVLVMEYQSGNLTGFDIFEWTGTQATWERKAFEITPNSNIDSISVIFSSGDNITGSNAIAGSWINIDNVKIKTSTQDMFIPPNHSFENWQTNSYEQPDNWMSYNQFLPDYPTVFKTTDSYSNTYAAKIETNNMTEGALFGTFFIPNPPSSLDLYYKHLPSGTDSSSIEISVFSGANIVGAGSSNVFSSTNTYSLLNIPISYTSSSSVDSVQIVITSGQNVGTKIFVDDIKLNYSLGIETSNSPINFVKLYPNPIKDNLIINYNIETSNSNGFISIYDAMGKKVFYQSVSLSKGNNNFNINTGQFLSGTYFITIESDNSYITKKFIKY